MKKLTNWIAVPVAIAARLGLTRGVAAIRVRPDRKSIEQMLLRAEGWKLLCKNAGETLDTCCCTTK